MLTFDNRSLNNWKEYFDYKFADKDKFLIEQFDKDNTFINSYKVTSTNLNCKTEIVFKIVKDNDFTDIFDLHFNHPNSPIWTESNLDNKYGWDGMGTNFISKHLIEVDKWIDIPLYHGWTETTFYFDGQEVKTEAKWYPDYRSIPIKQNYLRTGCLMTPIVLFQLLGNWQWKKFPNRMREDKKVIAPMLKE
jgi:hypothetical protein